MDGSTGDNSNNSSSGDDDDSALLIVVIILAILLTACLVGMLVFWFYFRKKRLNAVRVMGSESPQSTMTEGYWNPTASPLARQDTSPTKDQNFKPSEGPAHLVTAGTAFEAQQQFGSVNQELRKTLSSSVKAEPPVTVVTHEKDAAMRRLKEDLLNSSSN